MMAQIGEHEAPVALRATSLASFGCVALSADARWRCGGGCMDGIRVG